MPSLQQDSLNKQPCASQYECTIIKISESTDSAGPARCSDDHKRHSAILNL